MVASPPNSIYTKVAGVNSGYKKDGVVIRQLYLKKMKELGVTVLQLVREPENKFDPNAIAIYANIGTKVHIGYVQNRVRRCQSCDNVVEKATEDEDCPKCGGCLNRDGLATELAHYIDNGYNYKARVTQYTGGNGKTMGLNIIIEKIW